MRNNRLCIVAVSTIMGVCTGCASKDTDASAFDFNDEKFFAPENARLAERVSTQQAASGARSNAVLYPTHFHGQSLNSLGQRKLALMLADDDTSTPLVVYLDLPTEDPMVESRRAAVLAFLQSRGLAAEQVSLEAGPNPRSATPSATLLKNLSKTDSSPEDAAEAAGID